MIKNFIKNSNLEYYENVSFKKYNSYKLDVKVKYLVFPDKEDKLRELLKYLKENKIKYIVLGNGSNVLFANDYYDGVVIRLDRFNDLEINDDKVIVGAGYSLIKLAMLVANKSLSGLEFAAGIPGLIGASVAMNAGAYNQSLSEVVESVKAINPDGEIEVFDRKKIDFSYRDSFFKKNPKYTIISCELKLSFGDKEEILDIIEKRRTRRLESQPLDYPSAGSVFRNPEGLYAGKLIEDVGLKGYKIGGAMVSLKHANFIINFDKATGKDIVNLIDKIKREVKKKYGVDLILEQIIVD